MRKVNFRKKSGLTSVHDNSRPYRIGNGRYNLAII